MKKTMTIKEKSEYYKQVNEWIKELKEYNPKDNEKYSHYRILKHYKSVSKRLLIELKRTMDKIKTEKNDWGTGCRTTIGDEVISVNKCRECDYKGDMMTCIGRIQKDIMDTLLAKYFDEYEDEDI